MQPLLNYLSICSFLLSVLGFVLSYISLKRKQISVNRRTSIIISDDRIKPENLSIKYNDVEISNLSSTTFYIWNSSFSDIRTEDVDQCKPLRITSIGAADIVDVQIIKVANEGNSFCICEKKPKAVSLSFVYIDSGEGLQLQIFHTGSARDLVVDCKVIGGKEIRDCNYPHSKKQLRRELLWWVVQTAFPYITGILGGFLACLLLAAVFGSIEYSLFHFVLSGLITCGIGWLFWSLGIWLLGLLRKKAHLSIPLSIQ